MRRCPRCGADSEGDDRFCPSCGLDLAGTTAAQLKERLPPDHPPTGHTGRAAVSNYVAPPAQVPARSSIVTYPYSRMAGQSIVRALAPTTKPPSSFWVGLFMLLIGTVLVACPFTLAVALALGSGTANASQILGSGLIVSGCLALVLIVPGALLVAAGRPRS